MSAVKKAMGITSRNFFVSDVRQFLRENPGFKSKDSTYTGDTFKGLLEEALKALSGREDHCPKLIMRIHTKLASLAS